MNGQTTKKYTGCVYSLSAVDFDASGAPTFRFRLDPIDPPLPNGYDSIFDVELLRPEAQAIVIIVSQAYATQSKIVISTDLAANPKMRVDWVQVPKPPGVS